MIINVPGQGKLELKTIVLDLNGTIAVGGKLVKGVSKRLKTLNQKGFNIIFFSGDTRGNAKNLADKLGIQFIKASTAKDKDKEISKLDPQSCVAIGNGLIDLLKIRKAKLGIVTLQAEGVHTKTLLEADVVVPSINDALDLLIDEKNLIATLRK
jgi:P-type E1-E2 ATPase